MPRKAYPKNIPVHAKELSKHSGFKIEYVNSMTGLPADDEAYMQAHRDDHYMFFLQEKGTSGLMLDFVRTELKAPCLLYILPGQVHHYKDFKNATGWVMAIDALLIDNEFRAVFEDRLAGQQLKPDDIYPFSQSLQLIHYLDAQDAPSAHTVQALHALIKTFTGLAAAAFAARMPQAMHKELRATSITRSFKKRVAENFITVKTPAQYADMLNISLSYLNEAVKNTTGFPVSYWIQQEVLLEAKRLLYYTDLDAKQIAYRVGYEDHTYFSRLFKKVVLCSPLEFRRKYRE